MSIRINCELDSNLRSVSNCKYSIANECKHERNVRSSWLVWGLALRWLFLPRLDSNNQDIYRNVCVADFKILK